MELRDKLSIKIIKIMKRKILKKWEKEINKVGNEIEYFRPKEGTITFKKTVYNHRQLWKYTCYKIIKKEDKISKSEYFENYDINIPNSECFLCEYIKYYQNRCSYCPLYWGKEYTCTGVADSIGLYTKYLHSNEWEEAYYYANKISKLPIKKGIKKEIKRR
jgi:hypothetical protein